MAQPRRIDTSGAKPKPPPKKAAPKKPPPPGPRHAAEDKARTKAPPKPPGAFRNPETAPFKPGTIPFKQRQAAAKHETNLTAARLNTLIPLGVNPQPQQVGSKFGLADATRLFADAASSTAENVGDRSARPGGPPVPEQAGTRTNMPHLTERVALAKARQYRLKHGGLDAPELAAAEHHASQVLPTQIPQPVALPPGTFDTPPPKPPTDLRTKRAAGAPAGAHPEQSMAAQPQSKTGLFDQITTGYHTAFDPLIRDWNAVRPYTPAPFVERAVKAAAPHVGEQISNLDVVGAEPYFGTIAKAAAKIGKDTGFLHTDNATKAIGEIGQKGSRAISRAGDVDVGIPAAEAGVNAQKRFPGQKVITEAEFRQLEQEQGGLGGLPHETRTTLINRMVQLGWPRQDAIKMVDSDVIHYSGNAPSPFLLQFLKNAGSFASMQANAPAGFLAMGDAAVRALGGNTKPATGLVRQFVGGTAATLPVIGDRKWYDNLYWHPGEFAQNFAWGVGTADSLAGRFSRFAELPREITPDGFQQPITRGYYSKKPLQRGIEKVRDKLVQSENPVTNFIPHFGGIARRKAIAKQDYADFTARTTHPIQNAAMEHQVAVLHAAQKIGKHRVAALNSMLQGSEPGERAAFYRDITQQVGVWRGRGASAHARVSDSLTAQPNLTADDHAYVNAVRAAATFATETRAGAGQFSLNLAARYRIYQEPIQIAARGGDPLAQELLAARDYWLGELRSSKTRTGPSAAAKTATAKLQEVEREIKKHEKALERLGQTPGQIVENAGANDIGPRPTKANALAARRIQETEARAADTSLTPEQRARWEQKAEELRAKFPGQHPARVLAMRNSLRDKPIAGGAPDDVRNVPEGATYLGQSPVTKGHYVELPNGEIARSQSGAGPWRFESTAAGWRDVGRDIVFPKEGAPEPYQPPPLMSREEAMKSPFKAAPESAKTPRQRKPTTLQRDAHEAKQQLGHEIHYPKLYKTEEGAGIRAQQMQGANTEYHFEHYKVDGGWRVKGTRDMRPGEADYEVASLGGVELTYSSESTARAMAEKLTTQTGVEHTVDQLGTGQWAVMRPPGTPEPPGNPLLGLRDDEVAAAVSKMHKEKVPQQRIVEAIQEREEFEGRGKTKVVKTGDGTFDILTEGKKTGELRRTKPDETTAERYNRLDQEDAARATASRAEKDKLSGPDIEHRKNWAEKFLAEKPFDFKNKPPEGAFEDWGKASVRNRQGDGRDAERYTPDGAEQLVREHPLAAHLSDADLAKVVKAARISAGNLDWAFQTEKNVTGALEHLTGRYAAPEDHFAAMQRIGHEMDEARPREKPKAKPGEPRATEVRPPTPLSIGVTSRSLGLFPTEAAARAASEKWLADYEIKDPLELHPGADVEPRGSGKNKQWEVITKTRVHASDSQQAMWDAEIAHRWGITPEKDRVTHLEAAAKRRKFDEGLDRAVRGAPIAKAEPAAPRKAPVKTNSPGQGVMWKAYHADGTATPLFKLKRDAVAESLKESPAAKLARVKQAAADAPKAERDPEMERRSLEAGISRANKLGDTEKATQLKGELKAVLNDTPARTYEEQNNATSILGGKEPTKMQRANAEKSRKESDALIGAFKVGDDVQMKGSAGVVPGKIIKEADNGDLLVDFGDTFGGVSRVTPGALEYDIAKPKPGQGGPLPTSSGRPPTKPPRGKKAPAAPGEPPPRRSGIPSVEEAVAQHEADLAAWKKAKRQLDLAEKRTGGKTREHEASLRRLRRRADTLRLRADQSAHEAVSARDPGNVGDAGDAYSGALDKFIEQHEARPGTTTPVFIPQEVPRTLSARWRNRNAGKAMPVERVANIRATEDKLILSGDYRSTAAGIANETRRAALVQARIDLFNGVKAEYASQPIGGQIADPSVVYVKADALDTPVDLEHTVAMHNITDEQVASSIERARKRLEAGVIDVDKIDGFLPDDTSEILQIPRSIYDEIHASVQPYDPGSFALAYDTLNRGYQRFMLSKPSTGISNIAGNPILAMMGGASPWEATFKGYQLAKHPEWLPPQLLEGGLASQLRQGQAYTPIGKWVNYSLSKQRASEQAARAGLYHHLAGKHVARQAAALDMTADEVLRRMASGDDPMGFELARKVEQFLGDMKRSKKFGVGFERGLGRSVLFHRWLGHILTLSLYTLPIKYPGRALLLQRVSEIGDDYRKHHGIFPSWYVGMLPLMQHIVGGKVGEPGALESYTRALPTGSIWPTANLPIPLGDEQGANPLAFAWNSANPIVRAGVESALGYDISAMKPYKDAAGKPVKNFDLNLAAALAQRATPYMSYLYPAAGRGDTAHLGDWYARVNKNIHGRPLPPGYGTSSVPYGGNSPELSWQYGLGLASRLLVGGSGVQNIPSHTKGTEYRRIHTDQPLARAGYTTIMKERAKRRAKARKKAHH